MSETAKGGLLPDFGSFWLVLARAIPVKPQNSSETAAAWSVFRLNWLVLAGLWMTFGLCLLLTDFRVRSQGYIALLCVTLVYGCIGYAKAHSGARAKPWLFSFLTGLAQTVLAFSVLASLSYIVTAAGLPLQDANLLAIDQSLGFDFRHYLSFVNDRPWLITVLGFGYRSIAWSIVVIVVALPLLGHCRRIAEFNLAISLTAALTCCMTLIVPAVGVYYALGLTPSDYPNLLPQAYYDTARDMPLVRDGTLRLLDISQLVGIVTFPSFHAAAVVLYGWALWPLRWLRPFNVILNGTMLLSTPVGGGHFLIDIIAGIVIALVSILVARFVAQRADTLKALDQRPAEGCSAFLKTLRGFHQHQRA
uniref:phosphatase PAP2 family protein n=1 Tax=Bradyrhizobium sp. (strain ORS 278) TaxID=114615 RepID=UPI0005A02F99|nr:phosphatase PAP2 family protein [Bradyrhizobium sp. ORS 278]